MVEAVLLYRPGGQPGSNVECRIVSCTDRESVVAVAKAAAREAYRDAEGWRTLDPQIAAVRQADADRLDSVLRRLVPGYGEAE